VLIAHLILTLMAIGPLFDPAHQVQLARLFFATANVGVLLFFVHTSLVLLLSLERTPPRSLFLNFYIRRFFRIYPLSTVCIVVALLLRVPFVPNAAFVEPGWRAILSNLLLVQNLTHSQDIISVLWTLPREIQMYAMLPVIFVLLGRFGSVPLVLGLWWIAGIAAPHISLFAYVPCFMGGVLAYQIGKEKTYGLPGFVWPTSLAALVGARLWLSQTIFDNYSADFLFCMLVGGLIPHFRDISTSWLTGGCRVIARYSYGIYLFHVPVIWLALVKLHALPASLRWILLCVLLCAIPWIVYTCLEAPLIETGRRIAQSLTPRSEMSVSNRFDAELVPVPKPMQQL
jgi:peptidoglycan/LPS O-acetylase OafA/YrhL